MRKKKAILIAILVLIISNVNFCYFNPPFKLR